MTTTYLTAAETAKLVRKALKSNFPGVRFSVRSDTYSGGASIRVAWIDGPTEKAVDAACSPYVGADFDGMIDLKTHRDPVLLGDEDGNLRSVSFGADFIFTERRYSPAAYRSAAWKLAEYWGADFEALGELRIWKDQPFKGSEIANGFENGRTAMSVLCGRANVPREDFDVVLWRELKQEEL